MGTKLCLHSYLEWNRRLAAQTPTWDWVPEFAFAEGLFARSGPQPAAAVTAVGSDSGLCPLLCSLLDFARTYFAKKDRAVPGGGGDADA